VKEKGKKKEETHLRRHALLDGNDLAPGDLEGSLPTEDVGTEGKVSLCKMRLRQHSIKKREGERVNAPLT
jgi:hypothetical protein